MYDASSYSYPNSNSLGANSFPSTDYDVLLRLFCLWVQYDTMSPIFTSRLFVKFLPLDNI